MWVWSQRAGQMFRDDGELVGTGYSGHADGKNSPDHQATRGVGPIPRGRWRITEMIPRYGTHGPFVLRLQPEPGTETWGRAGFLIHGDSVAAPGTASLGCIVLPRPVREALWRSGDRSLTVVA